MSEYGEDTNNVVHLMAPANDDDELIHDVDSGDRHTIEGITFLDSLSYSHTSSTNYNTFIPTTTPANDNNVIQVVNIDDITRSKNSRNRKMNPTNITEGTIGTIGSLPDTAPPPETQSYRNSDLTVLMSNMDDGNVTGRKAKGTKKQIASPPEQSSEMLVDIPETVETVPMYQTHSVGSIQLFCSGVSKALVVRALIVLGILLFFGCFLFFLVQFFQIPGLNNQIDELENQVNLLEFNVDQLEVQVMRLNTSVNALGVEVDELRVENDRFDLLTVKLQMANAELAEQSQLLNSSNNVLQNQLNTLPAENKRLNATIFALEEQNSQLGILNSQLDEANAAYNASLTVLKITTAALIDGNSELNSEVLSLTNKTIDLARENMDLQNQTNDLTVKLSNLTLENDNLTSVNSQLADTILFLNQNNLGLNATLEDTLATLQGLLDANRAIVLSQLQLTYEQYIQSWDCNLYDNFAGKAWITNLTLPIGNDQDDVIQYIETRILQKICVNLVDFELFLGTSGFSDDGTNITIPDLESAVSKYTTQALTWYFPPSGNSTGVLASEWELYSYACNNLPESLKFSVL